MTNNFIEIIKDALRGRYFGLREKYLQAGAIGLMKFWKQLEKITVTYMMTEIIQKPLVSYRTRGCIFIAIKYRFHDLIASKNLPYSHVAALPVAFLLLSPSTLLTATTFHKNA